MTISTKKPPIKETVGALYYVFDTPTEDSNEFVDYLSADYVDSCESLEESD